MLQECINAAVDRYHSYQFKNFSVWTDKYPIGDDSGDRYPSTIIENFTAYMKHELLDHIKVKEKANMKLKKIHKNNRPLTHAAIKEDVKSLSSVFYHIDDTQLKYSDGVRRSTPDSVQRQRIKDSKEMKKVVECYCYSELRDAFSRAGMEDYVFKRSDVKINNHRSSSQDGWGHGFLEKNYEKWYEDYEEYLEGGYWYNEDKLRNPELFEGDGFYAKLKAKLEAYYERHALVSPY
jgi:hypothetical protein